MRSAAAGATRTVSGLAAAALCLAACTQAAPAEEAVPGASPAPTAAVHRPLRTAPTHPQRSSSAPPATRRPYLVQTGAWDATFDGATSGPGGAVHVDYVCAPAAGTCTLAVTNLGDSPADYAWTFSPDHSTNITSVSEPAGLLHPGERSPLVDVVVARCPATFGIADRIHGGVTAHDLCLD